MNGQQFGPQLTKAGVTFNLWAPEAKRVDVVIGEPQPMTRGDHGWFRLQVKDAQVGCLYRFRIDGELDIPDPASRFQPSDVAGPSEVIDHAAYHWQTSDWRGRPWQDVVFLETHVGTFTPQGSYREMIGRLDHLVSTGITALELMPLADFPGRWNWGYDGVLWYAPDSLYGRPDDLKALIDAAHARGLMVFLDVVYNHFGPEGNYLGHIAPSFFSRASTPWGNAINFCVREVRRFAIESALQWLRDYRFDGLRLDAVHAITNESETHLLHELSSAVGALAASTGRHIHLVLENDDNVASLLDPVTDPPRGKYRAQWNDDYHHAWHRLLTDETHGYYRDYAEPLNRLVRILRSGFAYQGEPSPHRRGALRGERSGELSPTAFVNFLQNHDQIGNRVFGDRLTAEPITLEAALAITLLAPMPPLLFMGEEWGATSPFPFFCDFAAPLADAVRRGRREEFSDAYKKHGDDIPDPLNEATFRSAILDWSAVAKPAAQKRLALVQRLLAIRHAEIVPHLDDCRFGDACAEDGILSAHWNFGDHYRLSLTANLSQRNITPPALPFGRTIWGKPAQPLPAWAVVWTMDR